MNGNKNYYLENYTLNESYNCPLFKLANLKTDQTFYLKLYKLSNVEFIYP